MSFEGKPISELDYPAITICSQGWIKKVVNSAMDKQFRDFLISEGLKITDSVSKEDLMDKYQKKMFPGATQTPLTLVTSLTSPNPDVTVASQASHHVSSYNF